MDPEKFLEYPASRVTVTGGMEFLMICLTLLEVFAMLLAHEHGQINYQAA